MLFAITVISWVGALITAKILRLTVIRGESTPFVMELPPYRFPTLKGLCIHTWERTWQYIKKAGTVILGISILVWAMMTFPLLSPEKEAFFEEARQEILASHMVEDAPEVLDEDVQKELLALEGRRAEEGTAYSLGEVDPEEGGSLSQVLKRSDQWSPLKAFSVILFVIFYAPCFVTLVCIAREAGSWTWGLFALLFNTLIAFLLSVGVFQLGTLLGLGI
jgi:ferrous iron transport protein B